MILVADSPTTTQMKAVPNTYVVTAFQSSGDNGRIIWLGSSNLYAVRSSTPPSTYGMTAWGTRGTSLGQMDEPQGIAVAMATGDVSVTEYRNHRVQRFSGQGASQAVWGKAGGGSGASSSAPGEFSGPRGVAVTASGRVYVVDERQQLQALDSLGTPVAGFPPIALGSGLGQLKHPSGVATAADGTIFVVDNNNNRIQKFTATGQPLGGWGRWGTAPGRFDYPEGGIAIDTAGNVYVADSFNHRIQKFTASGQFLAEYGRKLDGKPVAGVAPGEFGRPTGVAIDGAGNMYVSERGNARVQKLSPSGQPLQSWRWYGSALGEFTQPQSVALGPGDSLYVTDTQNHRVVRIAPSPGTPTPAPTIRSIRVANVRDTSFTVSWVTDVPATGSVAWRLDTTASPTFAADLRGATGTFGVHLVTVSGLMPATRYLFDVTSGATTDTNGGAHHAVTTGPTLGVTAPDLAYGTVSLRDGAIPGAVLVHVTADDSAPLVDLVTASDLKYWSVNLGNLRTASLGATFPVTGDTVLTVTADGGPDGTATGTTTVATARAGTFAIALADEVALPLSAGWNLVALRATPPTPITAAAVCAALNATVAGTAVELDRWVAGGWEGHRCGIPPNDFTLETGAGYFVRMTAPATWTYRGSLVATPATLSLGAGWNLVGAAAISGTPSTAAGACTLLNAASAGTAVELDRWIAGGWEGHRCGIPPNDFTLQAGQGYFVRLVRAATWAPVGAAPVSVSSSRR